jgi:hypothetical protein
MCDPGNTLSRFQTGARLCLAEGLLHTAEKIDDGLVKSAQTGKIDEAGRVKLTLREGPQEGANHIPFQPVFPSRERLEGTNQRIMCAAARIYAKKPWYSYLETLRRIAGDSCGEITVWRFQQRIPAAGRDDAGIPPKA